MHVICVLFSLFFFFPFFPCRQELDVCGIEGWNRVSAMRVHRQTGKDICLLYFALCMVQGFE